MDLDPLKNGFSKCDFFSMTLIGTCPEQSDTKIGLLWEISGFSIFCVDFYWPNTEDEEN